jgi:hypothetical protein
MSRVLYLYRAKVTGKRFDEVPEELKVFAASDGP